MKKNWESFHQNLVIDQLIELNDILVIVRSVGERTTDLASDLLKEIFSSENVIVLNEKPFSRAIERSLIVAQQKNKTWMLAIDADVLVSKKGVQEMLACALEYDEGVHVIQGLVYDKFFKVLRPAGNHLYRVKHAKKAIKSIPKEGSSLRPETDMLNRMAHKGYPWVQVDSVVGLHDFEQSLEDVFRKCFLQSQKHKGVLPLIRPFWEDGAQEDVDFYIALKAIEFGAKHKGKVYVDKRFLKEDIEKELKESSISEKEEEVVHLAIDDMLQEYMGNINSELQDSIFPKTQWSKVVDREYLKSKWSPSIKNKVKDKIKLILRSRK